MISKINQIMFYTPPKNLGEGLRRVKDAMGCTEMIINDHGHRLYRALNNGTVYMTIGELRKTSKIVSPSVKLNYTDYDTYAGTALRISNSQNAGKRGTYPNQLLQLLRFRFYSDAVKGVSGIKSKPLSAITDLGVINSKDGKPVLKYLHRSDVNQKARYIREMDSKDIPRKYTGVKAPDGNIRYYLRDTVEDGNRTVTTKLNEYGLDINVL